MPWSAAPEAWHAVLSLVSGGRIGAFSFGHRSARMITVITTYPLPEPMTHEQAQRNFLSTAPRYQSVTGLVRKYYYLSQDGKTIGGVYLWNSRTEAEAMFNDEWRTFMRNKYNSDPSVVYFDCPVVVDNLTHEILSGS
jgi:hypothetical protein